ncbi:MAG TPA: FAD:protein FMN transferase [Firmicutes bacterium]|nr:FAD:protein FMN transferase [Bacillota bacterium]
MKRMRWIPLLLAAVLAGCSPAAAVSGENGELQRYEASFLDLFDTVTSVVGYAPSEEEFRQTVEQLHDRLEEYHQLYDIYNLYDGVANLKTINDNAGVAPVMVDGRILDLLEFSQQVYQESGGQVNVAMGSVLSLWHQYREAGIEDPENAQLPPEDQLEEARNHCSMEGVVIDREASTVYLPDSQQSLDVGAVAKGYALERVCQEMAGTPMIVSLGGNVRAVAPRPDGSPWVIGVQDPDGGEEFLHRVEVGTGSVVTSGDYQRYYTVDGIRYHHIIDPETGYPANRYRAVTILCQDSGWGDGLSTALFTLPQEEGERLLQAHDAQAMWVLPDGSMTYSAGFEEYIQG